MEKLKNFGFKPENYKWLLIGLAINLIGFLLMIGGGAKSLNEFLTNPKLRLSKVELKPRLRC